MSRVTAIISALVICIIVCLSWLLIITVITPLPAVKPSATNARELLANAAITDMQMRQRDVAALDAMKGWLMLKLKMMLCVMMLPLVVVGCTSKQSVSQCVKLPAFASADEQPPPDWQTPLNGIISTLRERLITMQKQLEVEPRSILMSSR